MTVHCVFGSSAQEVMEELDPKWCEEHCGKTSVQRGDCYWHFMDRGIDPENTDTFRKHITE